ncbi:MAG TPA: P1 family peptidase [Gemmatimonadaceae bacterium]|nr:P1 family peptidase [Gemmatimonadaceae bacterium]
MSADFSAVGLAVGHATDERGATGLTVLRGVSGALRGAACVFGRATGTRELDALSPTHQAGRVDAVLVTGGSAYGLDAAAGVMRWMEERKRGFDVGTGVVPIVPAAVIFDLAPLGDFRARPTAQMAYDACERARPEHIDEGSVGVGTGATVGKGAGREHAMKGGFGCAVHASGNAVVCAAVVVNALGDVRDAHGRIIAGARSRTGEFLDSAGTLSRLSAQPQFAAPTPQHTTLAVVATNLALERGELAQLARAAGAALFKRITPVGTSFDGDVVFALCPPEAPRGALMPLELLATAALEEAIERGVRTAKGRDGVPGLADDTR